MEPALDRPARPTEGCLSWAPSGQRRAAASRAAALGLRSRERTAAVPVVPLRGCGQVGFGSFPRARAGVAAPSQRPPLPPVLEAAVRAGSGGRLAERPGDGLLELR